MEPTIIIFTGIFLCITNGAIVKGPRDDIFVQLSTGRLRGRTLYTENGNVGHTFLGVPYAEPPIGEYRFAIPGSKQKWRGTLDCFKYSAACMQNSSRVGSEPQHPVSEDCLTANLFIGTNCTESTPCPVLFYIHGGAHMFDSPRMFPPLLMVDNFASTGLVMVTIGYRLGSFGFWNTGQGDSMGNWALYDMIEGLRWVQREIVNFGGDKDSVTIMGHSSSAQDVPYLSLSPKTNGLFHRMVIMSGYASNELESNVEISKSLAERLGCGDSADIIRCMRGKPAEEVLGYQRELEQDGLSSWGPQTDGPNGLLPESPVELATDRIPYPTMTGTTLYEFGGPGLAPFLGNVTRKNLTQACTLTAPTLLPLGAKVSTVKVAELCTDFYANNGNYALGLIQLISAGSYVNKFLEVDSLRNASATVYLYSFDYVKKGTEGFGPMHAQDLTWLLGIHPVPFDERDTELLSVYPPLFANFAKYGNPTPWDNNWKSLRSPIGFNYYSINLPKPHNKEGYHREEIQFWTQLVPRIAGENQLNKHQPPEKLPVENDEALYFLKERIDSFNEDILEGKRILLAAPENSTTISRETDWETAFWATVAAAVLILLGLALSIGLNCCAAANERRKIAMVDAETTERSPLNEGKVPFYT